MTKKGAGTTKVIAVISLALFLASPLFAEEPAQLGEIFVGGSPDQNESIEAPSSFVTAIKPKTESSSFETVSDMIGASAGTTTTSLGGLGQFSTVSIRGSSPEQVAVYLDGVQLNTATSGAFDFSTIPTDSIERIEVIRGGGTAQFGSDAIGGVINIITKKAKEGRTMEVTAGGGSFTTIKMGASYMEKFKKNDLVFSWNQLQSKGNFRFKTNGMSFSGSPSPVGGGQTFTRIHNGFLSEAATLKWAHDFSETLSLNLLNDFFFINRDVPGPEEETTLLYPTNPLEAKEQIFRNTTSAVLRKNECFSEKLGCEIGLNNNFNADIFKNPTPSLGNPINITTDNYAIASYAKLDIALDHKFLTQFIRFRYDYQFDLVMDSSPLPNAVLTGTHKRSVNSVFGEDELGFWNGKIVILPTVRFENASDFSSDIGAKGGIKITPVKFISIKSNIERSFRYPSFSELYFPDQGYIRGNPDLQKESAINLDAGLGLNLKYASLEAAFFRNWVKNSIIFVPISALTIMPVNTFDVAVYGAEGSLAVDPIENIHLGVNYTYLKANYVANDDQLPGRPKHEVNARVELNKKLMKELKGTIFGNYNYKGSFPINVANTVFLAARSTVDLGFTANFKKYYTFNFEAKNITNVQTYDARGYPLPRFNLFANFGAKWS